MLLETFAADAVVSVVCGVVAARLQSALVNASTLTRAEVARQDQGR
ncbi:hypothetical protein ABT369_01355 [Dactylosporangium sp. NPDC000244]